MSSNERVTLRAEKLPFNRGVELFLLQGSHIGVSVTMEPLPQECTPSREFLTLAPTEAQILIDDLWASGYRPSEGSGSAGALRATEAHLEDMRTFAFKLIQDRMEELNRLQEELKPVDLGPFADLMRPAGEGTE